MSNALKQALKERKLYGCKVYVFTQSNKDQKINQKENETITGIVERTLGKVFSSPDSYQEYLDLQSIMPNHSVENTLLIWAQLENTDNPAARPWSKDSPERRDVGRLVTALVLGSPVDLIADNSLNCQGFYSPDDRAIFIRTDLDEATEFRVLANELAVVEMNHAGWEITGFEEKSAAYIVCKRFGVDTSGFNFDEVPEYLDHCDSGQLRSMLNETHLTANALCLRTETVLLRQMHKANSKPER
jgi:hypothetical protein